MSHGAQDIHRAASSGYAVGADTYVRGRPDYPAELDPWLRNVVGLAAGSTVVDLGAGTGKFTPRLIATGARVIAVEPVAAMLAKLSSAYPAVDALPGRANSIPLPDACVDAIVCAQSFHWFATHAALAEMYRVLKPGGKLALVWNLRDASVPWVAALDAIVNVYEGNTPRYYTGAWRKAFPFKGFGPLSEQHFTQPHTGSPDDVIVNRVKSVSFIAALSADEQDDIARRIRALIAAEPELAGRDIVTLPYDTAAFVAQKIGGQAA